LASNPTGDNSQLIAITRQELESNELVGPPIDSESVNVKSPMTESVQ
jgi:hypothetical protein